jgi:hypothetical protein
MAFKDLFTFFTRASFAPKGEAAYEEPTLLAAAGDGMLVPQDPPKVKPKQQSFPAHARNLTPSTSRLTQPDLRLANIDITAQARSGSNTPAVIRTLVKANPDLSAAVSANLRLGIPEKYIAIARSPDGQFNLEATTLVYQLLRRFAYSPDYSQGFSQTESLRSLSEAVGKELLIDGAGCLELVLDKQRLPYKLVPVSIPSIKWYEDDKGLRPVQVVGGTEVDLDFPTVFYVATDADLVDPYAQSPLESAVQAVLASGQFLNDLRRICHRSVYPRMVVDIDLEKLRAEIPPDVQADATKLAEYMETVKSGVENMVNGLQPEDAMVIFSFIKVSYMQGQSGDVPATFDTIKSIHDAKIATGAKTLPSILGHGAGSQNVASTETQLAVKTADSLVRMKLQELYSRALTMAVRLYGVEATVSFEFDTIDLRPAAELEAFMTMRQSRLLQQLSFGYITDAEYCLRTTGNLPPVGIALAGTRFQDTPADTSNNPYSGAPQGGGQSGGGAATQAVKSKTPEQAKGPAKK